MPDGGFVATHTDITERKRVEKDLSDAFTLIKESVDYASYIQQSLLPPIEYLREDLDDVLIVWQPRDVVGGDLYWYRRYDGGFLVMLGDCTGHGVPGAFITLIASGALDRALREHRDADPAKLLAAMNRSIKITLGQDEAEGSSDDGLDLGICRVDTKTPSLTYAGAKFSLFCIREEAAEEIKGDKASIGYRKVSLEQSYTNHRVDLEVGTNFVMVTDGIIDQVGGTSRRTFGKRRFLDVMCANAKHSLPDQGDALMAALTEYQGAERRRDDVTVVGFRL